MSASKPNIQDDPPSIGVLISVPWLPDYLDVEAHVMERTKKRVLSFYEPWSTIALWNGKERQLQKVREMFANKTITNLTRKEIVKGGRERTSE